MSLIDALHLLLQIVERVDVLSDEEQEAVDVAMQHISGSWTDPD